MAENEFKYPSLTGIIKDFVFFSAENLEALRLDLRLSMPAALLGLCRTYYAENLFRDATCDELFFLDTLYRQVRKERGLSVYELLTDDKKTADTYADFMEKLNALNPDFHGPVPFECLFFTASDYLSALGRKDFTGSNVLLAKGKNITGILARLYAATSESERGIAEKYGIGANAELIVRAERRNVPFRTIEKTRKKKSVILICPEINESGSAEDFQLKAVRFLENPRIRLLTSEKRVIKSGIVLTLLGLKQGIEISLDALPNTANLASLAVYGKCCVLAVCAEEYLSELQNTAARYGVRVLKVGHKTKSRYLRITHQVDTLSFIPLVSFRFEFLQTFLAACTAKPVTVRGSKETKTDLSVTDNNGLIFETNSGLFSEHSGCRLLEERKTDTADCGDFTAYMWIGKDTLPPFERAETQVINAVAQATASGASLANGEIQLSNSLCVTELDLNGNNDKQTFDIISFLLGLYRAQTELAVADFGSIYSDCINSTTGISSFTLAFAKKQKYKNIKGGNALDNELTVGEVYYLKPETDENGFPSYESLRRLFAYITGLLDSGRAVSVRAVTESIADAVLRLADASEGTVIFSVPPETLIENISGAFAVLAADGVKDIGLKVADIKRVETQDTLAMQDSLVIIDKYVTEKSESNSDYGDKKKPNTQIHVLIPILPGTGETEPLAKLLAEYGADCARPLISTPDGYPSSLVTVLLADTDVLIVGGEKYVSDAFINSNHNAICDFAAKGGRILLVSEAAKCDFTSENGNVTRFPRGIPENKLAQILR